MEEIDQLNQQFDGIYYRSNVHGNRVGLSIKKVLIIGSCMSEGLFLRIPWEKEMITYNGGIFDFSSTTPEELSLVVAQIPLRSIIKDDLFWRVAHDDETSGSELLNETFNRLERSVNSIRQGLQGINAPIYFLNFAVPTINPWGRLVKRFSPTNIQYVIGQLNERLENLAHQEDNSFVIDYDNILNAHGKRYFYEEMFGHFSHGALRNIEHEGGKGDRLEITPPENKYFRVQNNSQVFDSIITELIAAESVRTQRDQAKLIIFDLDDTLWRGVAAEMSSDLTAEDTEPVGEQNPYSVGELGYLSEGWPLGIVEAITYCRRRGILVSIVSKNERETVEKLFPMIFGHRISLSDFILPQISRKPKEESIGNLLAELNLLSKNAVFIDDNPIEREAVKRAYPDIRVWGKYFLYTRWWLLTSSIFQVPYITSESSRRQDSIFSRITTGNQHIGNLERGGFLASLNIQCEIFEVDCTKSSERRNRAVELINKTNQWNLSGVKLDFDSIRNYGLEGGRVFGIQVSDRYTAYGSVGFVMLKEGFLNQYVLSCRVFGMGIEDFFIVKCMALVQKTSIKFNFNRTAWNRPLSDWLVKVVKVKDTIRTDDLNQLSGSYIIDKSVKYDPEQL